MEPPGHDPFGYTACRTGDLLVRRMIWKRVVDSRRAQTCSVVDFSTEPTIASDLASVDRPVFEELWEAGQRIAVPLMSLPRIYAMLDGTCSASAVTVFTTASLCTGRAARLAGSDLRLGCTRCGKSWRLDSRRAVIDTGPRSGARVVRPGSQTGHSRNCRSPCLCLDARPLPHK